MLADFPWFYETNGGVFNLYKQPYWYAVVALVALAISVCTVSRAPPIWRTVRKPPKRVNAAYFDRARHRASADIAEGTTPASAQAQLVKRLRAARYTVEEVDARDGQAGQESQVMLFADRYGWAQLATFVTHLALLLLLGATLVTKFAGEEYQFWVAEGESHILFPPGDDRAQVQIIVDDAVARFADDGQALDFRSFVRVAEGGFEVGGGEVTVNGPVHAAGYRVHQAAYWEHGAELRVFDHASGQLLYAETHFLDQQIVGPRIRVERGGAVVSEEVISLEHQVADVVIDEESDDPRVAGYTLIPLDGVRSLAITLVPVAEGFEFWYRVIATPQQPSGLTFADLGVEEQPPLAPRLAISVDGEIVFDGLVSLDQAQNEARLAALPLAEDRFIWIGFQDGEVGEGFFYYSPDRDDERGGLAIGESVELSGGVRLAFLGSEPDLALQGSLEQDQTQSVGTIALTWLGAESVFYEVAPDIPGASGDALIALERFGLARTAEQFDALGRRERTARGRLDQRVIGRRPGRTPVADDSRPRRRDRPDRTGRGPGDRPERTALSVRRAARVHRTQCATRSGRDRLLGRDRARHRRNDDDLLHAQAPDLGSGNQRPGTTGRPGRSRYRHDLRTPTPGQRRYRPEAQTPFRTATRIVRRRLRST